MKTFTPVDDVAIQKAWIAYIRATAEAVINRAKLARTSATPRTTRNMAK